MPCPGYERKAWYSKKCKWYKHIFSFWVGSSSFCNHLESSTGICFTGGKEQKETKSES